MLPAVTPDARRNRVLFIRLSPCSYIGQSRTASTGAILMMIGAFVWLVGQILYTVIALIVASVTALMPEMVHRQRAWFSIASTLFFLMGWIFFMTA